MVDAGGDDLPALGVEDEVGDVAGLSAVVCGGQQPSLGRWRQVGLPGVVLDEVQVGFRLPDDYIRGYLRGYLGYLRGYLGWVCSVDGFGGHFRFTLPFLSPRDWVPGPGLGWIIKPVGPRDSPGQSPVAPGQSPVAPGRLRVAPPVSRK